MIACDLTFEYVLFGCYSISTPLYMLVLWVLAIAPSSDKVLCTPFFRIIISTGTLDIIVASSGYFGTKFRLWGWAYNFYAQINPFARFINWVCISATFLQSIGTILVALNRFTALALPFRYQDIWSSTRVRLCIAAQWLIPAVITVPGAFFGLQDNIFFMVPDNGMINGTNYTGLLPFPVIVSDRNALTGFTTRVFLYLVIIAFAIGAIVVLVIYLRLFCVMRKIIRKNQPSMNQQQQQAKAAFSREIRLLGYGIIMVVLQGLGATFSLLLIYDGFNTWYRPLSTITDFNCYIHPYFLLLLSTPLRNRCLTYVRLRQLSHVNTSQAQLSRRNVASSSAAIVAVQRTTG